MEAGPLGQPVANRLSLVCAIVVQDQMDVQLLRYILFDGIEEVAELAGAMPLLGLADDPAGPGVERGEQTGGAVTFVVMGAALDLSGTHGQQRRGAVERLDLALLVHAEHQRAVRRSEIQAHNVAHLVDEQRVAAELEGLGAMRREREGPPDAADGRLAESAGLGHVARGPVRGRFRLALERARQHLLDLLVAQLAWCAGPGLIQQTVDTELDETLSPLACGRQGASLLASDLGVAQSIRREQHDPRPQGQRLRGLRAPRPGLQLLTLLRGHGEWNQWASARHRASSSLYPMRKIAFIMQITLDSGHYWGFCCCWRRRWSSS